VGNTYPFQSSLGVAVPRCCSLKDEITLRDNGIHQKIRKFQLLIDMIIFSVINNMDIIMTDDLPKIDNNLRRWEK